LYPQNGGAYGFRFQFFARPACRILEEQGITTRIATEDASFDFRDLTPEQAQETQAFVRGVIGQMLYLEAEAAGVRGTGIGCFFDDPVHDILGLKDRSFQSLYHFTIGHPVEDTRIATLPAYDHLG